MQNIILTKFRYFFIAQLSITSLTLPCKENNLKLRTVLRLKMVSFQLYNFGETVSIPFWTDNWKPDSFYGKILKVVTKFT